MDPQAGEQKKKEKILIIEGDSTFGEALSSSLSNLGYVVSLYKNGDDGVKAIFDILPHLILVDVVLSGKNGYEILKMIQAEPMLKSIPLFLLSTQGVPVNIGQVPAGSVKEYILAFHSDTKEVVDKINAYFHHEAGNTNSISDTSPNMKKILWVEDDRLISNILSKKLVSSSFELIHAKNGEEAFNSLTKSRPNVIVLDLLLPGISGFDILKGIKDDPKYKDIPVMILSNLSKQSDMERAKILGAKKFIVKASSSLDQIAGEIAILCN